MSGSTEPSKICPDCAQQRQLADFPRNASRADGHGLYCKDCFSIRYREYRERKAAKAGRVIRDRRHREPGTKYCPRCKQTLAEADFGRNRSTRDGFTAYCRSCHNTAVWESKDRNGGFREYHLRRRYGIGQAQVDAMVEAQGGVCAACRTDKPNHGDHDHRTGRVRGMLCSLCNQALGNVHDEIPRLRGLIDYLHRDRIAALSLTITEVEHTGTIIEVDFRRFHAA